MSGRIESRIRRICRDLRSETPSTRRDAQHTLAARMAAYATPGASIAVIDDFEVEWARGFGIRKSRARAKVLPTTPFQAASISKPVFALAVMRLVQDGVLELDADVSKHLRFWQLPANDGWQPRVTLRQLLSHTAGATVHGFKGYAVTARRPNLLQVLRGVRPANSPSVIIDLLPGLHQRYSGGGFTIAQQVVSDVTRTPLAKLMRDLILDPLGMEHSTFVQPLPGKLAAQAAAAHPWNGTPMPGRWHVYPELAAAGLWSTAADLARLGVEFMRALRGERSALGLKQDIAAQMLRPQLPGQAIGGDFIGLGWACTGQGDAFCCGHTGWNEGFVAQISLLPKAGKGSVVMLNSNQGEPLRGEIRSAIGREYEWPGAGEKAPRSMATLAYDGEYRDAAGNVFRVARAGQGLLLNFSDQTPVPLTLRSGSEFWSELLDLRVRFDSPADAPSRSIAIEMGDKIIVAHRSPA